MIKNIIFDFGVVLIDINTNYAIDAFKAMGVNDFDRFFTLESQINLFDRLETGRISIGNFCEEFRQLTGSKISDKEIIGAWNTILLDIPNDKLDCLYQLQKHYNLYLLSNTNEIHIEHFNKSFNYKGNGFSQFFKKEYYSYKLGLRKPNVDIYNYVLDDACILSKETLFVDDNRDNIEVAKSIGINTILYKKGILLSNALKEMDVFGI